MRAICLFELPLTRSSRTRSCLRVNVDKIVAGDPIPVAPRDVDRFGVELPHDLGRQIDAAGKNLTQRIDHHVTRRCLCDETDGAVADRFDDGRLFRSSPTRQRSGSPASHDAARLRLASPSIPGIIRSSRIRSRSGFARASSTAPSKSHASRHTCWQPACPRARPVPPHRSRRFPEQGVIIGDEDVEPIVHRTISARGGPLCSVEHPIV